MPADIKVSVLMSNYNHGHYIGEALESIISQSYLPLEIIIIDDASTDNSVEIIQQFQRHCPLIELLLNKDNLGIFKNSEILFKLAQGNFIATLAADDKWLPGFLQKSVTTIKQYPDTALCCTNPVYFDDAGNTRVIDLSWLRQPGHLTPDELAAVIKGGFVFGHTAIFNKDRLISCGGYDPELKWHCDWFTSLVMAFRHGICYIPEGLSAMRENSNTYSTAGRQDWQEQKKVIANVIRRIKSPEYRDVFPHFVRGNIMAHFGDDAVKAVIEYPDLWDIETNMLIQKQLNGYLQNCDPMVPLEKSFPFAKLSFDDYTVNKNILLQHFNNPTENFIHTKLHQTIWHQTFEIVPGMTTPGVSELNAASFLDKFGIPANLKGIRALDIGTWDGAIAFELEKRGATVIALGNQHPDQTGFNTAKEILCSEVEYLQGSMINIPHHLEHNFDIIFFCNLFNQTKNPIESFEIVANLLAPGGTLCFEGEILLHYAEPPDGKSTIDIPVETLAISDVPLTLCYPSGYKQSSYWFIPNLACIKSWLSAAGLTLLVHEMYSKPEETPVPLQKICALARK